MRVSVRVYQVIKLTSYFIVVCSDGFCLACFMQGEHDHYTMWFGEVFLFVSDSSR
ncbi:hypothetical protein 0305phi8-36p242 [Bacillus phage 0305phi8-36]|uniref:hypothetical protein n=1 Tax=Bacillus phage 0305phi8-36 TaxID=458639 RepID=UPI00015A1FBC|nr:hypothetical protein ST0305phi8-36p242 [Bacillus phage 0305phi8-36]ABS83811.1 hypothetical protein 0305phi8-36p242 [Bacillus phage 0305phi8-36]